MTSLDTKEARLRRARNNYILALSDYKGAEAAQRRQTDAHAVVEEHLNFGDVTPVAIKDMRGQTRRYLVDSVDALYDAVSREAVGRFRLITGGKDLDRSQRRGMMDAEQIHFVGVLGKRDPELEEEENRWRRQRNRQAKLITDEDVELLRVAAELAEEQLAIAKALYE